MAALMAAPSAWATHVRVVVAEPPADGAHGLLIAGRGKTVSRDGASRILDSVPRAQCPCPVTIFVTLPGKRIHNVRRFRVAIVGGGYHGLLLSDRTKIPGLVSLYDIEPTVKALNRGETPPLTSRPESNVEVTLRSLDQRLTQAHDSRGAAAYVVFGLVALFALLAIGLKSPFWGRAALLAGPVALTASLALSGLEIARARSVGLSLLVVVGLVAPALAAITRSRLAFAAALLAVFAVYAGVLAVSQETSSLAALGPHPDGGVRFYGISNQVETLLLVPALLGGALLGAGLLPLLAVCVLAVVGASGLGADGGGVLVLAAGLLFLWLRLRGVALTARNLVFAGAAAIGLGLVLVGLDAAAGGSSHVTRTIGDGPGALFSELAHRWRVSLEGYVATWQATAIITCSLAVLVWIAFRRPRFATVDAVLVALAVSLLVNDSPRDVVAYGALSCAALRIWEETRQVQ